MRRALAVALLAAILSAAAAGKPPPVRQFEPSSNWVVDYANERCSLMRDFGTGDDTVRFQLDSYGSWSDFRVLLVGKPISITTSPSARASIRFSNELLYREVGILQGISGAEKRPSISFQVLIAPETNAEDWEGLSKDEAKRRAYEWQKPHPDFEAKIDALTVRPARGSPIKVHLGDMVQPLAAMRACVDDLYKSWGLEPAQQKALSRPASPIEATVKHMQQDYPQRMLLTGTSAYVPVRLLIDASGEATSCVVQSDVADEAFKAAVCQNLQGSFDPALDAGGRPVASVYHTSVVFLMGGWQR